MNKHSSTTRYPHADEVLDTLTWAFPRVEDRTDEQVAQMQAMSRADIITEAVCWLHRVDPDQLSDNAWAEDLARTKRWLDFVTERDERLFDRTGGLKGKAPNAHMIRGGFLTIDDTTRARAFHDLSLGDDGLAVLVIEDLTPVDPYEIDGVTRNEQWIVRNVAKVGTSPEDALDVFEQMKMQRTTQRNHLSFQHRTDDVDVINRIADGLDPVPFNDDGSTTTVKK